MMHQSLKMNPRGFSFSGRVPKLAGESNFETWLLHVELTVCSTTMSLLKHRGGEY